MEVLIIQILKFIFGEEPRFAMLAIFCFLTMIAMHKRTSKKLDKVWEQVDPIKLKQADQNRRLDDHADHFNVMRDDIDRSLNQADSSMNLSAKAHGLIIDLTSKIIKKAK